MLRLPTTYGDFVPVPEVFSRNLLARLFAACEASSMIRTATVTDIPRLREIRESVRENRLSDPSRVTLADYDWHIAHAPIHVWEDDGVIKGLSAGDPRDGSIWALFVDPTFKGRGIGQALAATNSIAAAGHRVAKLSTEPGTRAERFYLRNGWMAKGRTERGEVIFTKDL
jgi:GNAT superfamily N-acetyltransferase